MALEDATANVVVTDPPYFDAIAYADLSDFFYVWLKRAIGPEFPATFSTPLSPKTEEATALRHRHAGNAQLARDHFTSKLAAVLAESKRVCALDGVLAVMFAHQSTEAWTALVDALFEAGLNITATFPIDTERGARSVALDSSALATSITVMCRRREIVGAGSLRQVRRGIDSVVAESVHRFWNYGFRGADLIVACYGPAVGVFGQYAHVERGDGTPVEVPELLQIARESALKAIVGEFTGDALSRLYFVWANLYGASDQAWDDARLVAQLGGAGEDAMELARGHALFVVDGAQCRLALADDRAEFLRRAHLNADAPLVDLLHLAMILWTTSRRAELVNFARDCALFDNGSLWKLAQALFEVLPRESRDWKAIAALLAERDTLARQVRDEAPAPLPITGNLFAEI